MKNLVKMELQSVEGLVTITSDVWQSNSQLSYLGATCHFINDSMGLKNKSLCLTYLTEPKSALYLERTLNEALVRWGIESKVNA